MSTIAENVIVNAIGKGPSTGSVLEFTVDFPKAFSYPPVVTANVIITPKYHDSGPFPDAFTLDVYGVSATQFTARIYRVDTEGVGWEMPLSLGYIAMSTTTV